VVGVERRRVDRRLQVEPVVDMAQKEHERPLILRVPARCAEREHGLAVAQRQERGESRARAFGCAASSQTICARNTGHWPQQLILHTV